MVSGEIIGWAGASRANEVHPGKAEKTGTNNAVAKLNLPKGGQAGSKRADRNVPDFSLNPDSLRAGALGSFVAQGAGSRMEAKPISRGWGNRLRVLVIGATGGTGRQLVQQALEQGHQVTAFVRDPAKLKIEHANLRVAKGDVLDYASVEAAMRGQSAVLSALGHKRFFYPNKIQSNGMRNILRAMKACDVPRLICETALGIGNSVGRLGLPHTFFILPLILPFYMWDKLRQEN